MLVPIRDERGPLHATPLFCRIMEGVQIPEDGGSRRHGATLLLAPASLEFPTPGSPQSVQFGFLEDTAEALIALEDLEIADALPACEIQEDQGEHDLGVSPTLAGPPNKEVRANGLDEP